MTLRAKLVAALVLLAAGVTVAVGFFSYAATADRLNAQINDSLKTSIEGMLNRSGFDADMGLGGPPGGRGGGDAQVLQQAIDSNGNLLGRSYTALPVTSLDRQIASQTVPGVGRRRNITIDGERYRIETVSTGDGRAAQAARSLTENTRVLASLRDRILLAAGAVVLLAAVVGWLIAYQVTRRLRSLTDTAELVAKTGDLTVDVPVEGSDEAGRLAVAFNEMLTALARSKEDQQRLVQDAGHELRTPLTSLRTNTSVLRRHELSPEDRSQVLDDLDSETRELTDLVNELVELATDRSRDEPTEPVVLADVAERVAARARRRSGREVVVDADESVVLGRRQALERALSNLVDNALKFDDAGVAPVDVRIRAGRVTVLDRGPGIDPADVPHLFDRFFRSIAARSRPGSGLGLSIVRDIAERHGGTVFAEPREGGGAAIGFMIPVVHGDGTQPRPVLAPPSPAPPSAAPANGHDGIEVAELSEPHEPTPSDPLERGQ